ncbi:MAG: PAS domain S-box protein [bacterium]
MSNTSPSVHQAICSHSLTGIFIHSGGCLSYCNPRLLEMLGHEPGKPAQCLGKPFLDLVFPDDRETTAHRIDSLIAGESPPYRFTVRLLKQDGDSLWADILVSTFQQAAETQVLGNVIDITEHKNVEQALRESEAHLRSLSGATSEGILLHEDGRLIDANETFFQLSGYGPEELAQISLFDLLTPETRPVMEEMYNSRTEGTREVVGIRKNGQQIPIDLSARTIDYAGRQVRMVAIRDVSLRKQAEQEKAHLIAILESTPDMVATANPAGEILFMNRSGKQLVGLNPAADTSRMKTTDLHPPGIGEEITNTAIPVTIRDGIFTHETWLQHLDGRKIPVSQVIMAHYSPEGELAYFSTIVRDISGLIHVEGALEESEQKFRNIIQSSPMGIHMYELDAEDNLLFVGSNPAADKILGVEHAQFLGKTIEQAFPPLADTEIPDRYRQAAAKGIPWQTAQVDYETNQIAGAYEVYAFQTSPNRMAVMFLDITNRLRAERALRESESRHRSLFESMARGVVYQNATGAITAANPAAERILGMAFDQMNGCTSSDPRWHALREDGTEFPGDEHPSMIALRSGQPATAIMGTYNPKLEEHRWLDILATPQFRKGEKAPFQVFTTFSDITDRRRAESQRQELEDQLRQAQKMEAIGRLAGGLAHDFNNLLTAISGYSDLMAYDLPQQHPLQENVEEIRKASKRAASLTQQLLAFSRKQLISPRLMDLNALVVDARKMLVRLIGEDIEFRFTPANSASYVTADPNQIDQILINLAVNARDAMPDGGLLLIATEGFQFDEESCQSYPDIKPGEYVLLQVSDTGCGMDEATQERVFEPFFTTKEPGHGTGLGLATVYGIVRQNHGAINIHSEPNAGTTINIFLPRGEDLDWLEDEITEPPVLAGTETILLAEDEIMVRNLAQKMLEGQGYQVLASESVEDALDICHRHEDHIDVLLTDVIMPGMNGKELFHKLQVMRPDLKVLFMSGYSQDIIAHRGILEDDSSFLTKPFSAEALGRKIRLVLDRGE